MPCNGWKLLVEGKFRSLDGVDKAHVDLTKGEAIVHSKNPVSYSIRVKCL